MKTKTDLYTKIVLTVIAVALLGNLLKDTDFVTKAHAGELDLSASAMEKAADEDDGEITFFVYENNMIDKPFSKDNYKECEISKEDVPTHIITTKTIKQEKYPYDFRFDPIIIRRVIEK